MNFGPTDDKLATQEFIKSYHSKLIFARPNELPAFAKLMKEFIQNLPKGKKSLIHYQDDPAFIEFRDRFLKVLLKLELNDDVGTYTQGIEISLLQSLAKLPIALSTPLPKEKNGFGPDTYGKVIENFIKRATRNLQNITNPPALTFTAAALTKFDVDSFEKSVPSNDYLSLTTIENQPIQGFVTVCLNKLNEKQFKDPPTIIRLIHSIILLSPDNNRKTHISNEAAYKLLSSIKDVRLNPDDKAERTLANQLFFIKAIYPNVFPKELESTIAPFVKVFAGQSHGSRFEGVVQSELLSAIEELRKDYPHLIDVNNIDFNNPINASLGLESDLSYIDKDLKVSIQVDGDKYHCYPGTTKTKKQTKLRDECFLIGEWKIINFSDAQHGQDKAKEALFNAIVVPCFEAKTRDNIQAVSTTIKRLEKAKLACNNMTSASITDITKSVDQQLKDITARLEKPPYNFRTNEQLNILNDLKNKMENYKKSHRELSTVSNLISTLEKDRETATSLGKTSFEMNRLQSLIKQLSADNIILEQALSSITSELSLNASIMENLQLDESKMSCALEVQKNKKENIATDQKDCDSYTNTYDRDTFTIPQQTKLQSWIEKYKIDIKDKHNRAILKDLQAEIPKFLALECIAYTKSQKIIEGCIKEIAKVKEALKNLEVKREFAQQQLANNSNSLAQAQKNLRYFESMLLKPIVGNSTIESAKPILDIVRTTPMTQEGLTKLLTQYSQQAKQLAEQLPTIETPKVKTQQSMDSAPLNPGASTFIPQTQQPQEYYSVPYQGGGYPMSYDGYYYMPYHVGYSPVMQQQGIPLVMTTGYDHSRDNLPPFNTGQQYQAPNNNQQNYTKRQIVVASKK